MLVNYCFFYYLLLLELLIYLKQKFAFVICKINILKKIKFQFYFIKQITVNM